MRFGDVLSFRKDIFFDGAVQIDWFYNQEKARMVAENFVFHGNEYFGFGETEGKKLTDTVKFVYDIVSKIDDDQHVNPLTLAIAGYGTGKSHLAVTLAELLSGENYEPEVHQTILRNISGIDKNKGELIANGTKKQNLVLVLNGMRDFNLHYELLRSAQKSLRLYGYPDDSLQKLNRAIETAFRFFERNAKTSIHLFEEKAHQYGYHEKGDALISLLRSQLGEEEIAFNVINAVYSEINGNDIRWDEGVSASAVLENLITEYCGISGPFNKVVILFDEFGRYLEYASSTSTARSGDSALQQIFESAQNAEGGIQIINFIQSDIKSYLQRVDQTSNISRYIGRYDASDKYYLSSNLETVFANLIQRDNKEAFNQTIRVWQQNRESEWEEIFSDMNRWLPTVGVWKDYNLFRQVVVEGIYPLHPLSSFMLSQLSDYLQNRSSLMLLGRYVNEYATFKLDSDNVPFVYPETLLAGDLFTEMLSAEEEGRQYSQHCIRFKNVLRKYIDKLSVNSIKVLRANLAIRILRCRTESYDDAKKALCTFSGLNLQTVEEELVWLENEYAVIGYDDHSCCFDFLEDSSGAHDFKTFFKRLSAKTIFSQSILEDSRIRELAEILAPQPSNFGTKHKIKTNEWQFEQDLFSINDLSLAFIQSCLKTWTAAVTPDKNKGKLIWLYLNRDSASNALDQACALSQYLQNTPIVLMLLNDVDNRLNGLLCDYIALQSVSDADKTKYGRHYDDKLNQTQENIKNAFDALKKQRLHITPDGIQAFDNRLALSLTDVYEKVYPRAVPFDFDGFDSKQPGKARKAFCSITRLILSGALNGDTVHSFPADVRNRLEATLFSTGAFSWKTVNTSYQIVPPEQKAVRSIYDEIIASLPEGGELSVDNLLNQLVQPPYGMNDYVAVYMLVVICANLSYCLRAVLNGAVYSIASWKDEVIQDNKVDLALIRKTTLKRVNAGAVADRFLRLFAQIDGNFDVSKVDALSNELEILKQSESIPDELAAQYQLALNKIQEGYRIRRRWETQLEEVNQKYDKLLEDRDIYSGLLAIQLLDGATFYSCFMDSSYAMTEEQRNQLAALKSKIKQLVDPFIMGWISEQRCKGVENISQYRKHMDRVQKLLLSLGYVMESKAAISRAEKELSNVETIKARQQLRSNYSNYLQVSVVKSVTPYTLLLEWKKQGEDLLESISKFSGDLGKDAEKFHAVVSKRLEEINAAIEKIKQDMMSIYDDMYSIAGLDDIEDMISRIHLVCQKGIPSADLADFAELRKTLESTLSDIRSLTDCKEDREAFVVLYQELVEKYSNMETDFDVISIIKQIADSIIDNLTAKDKQWCAKYLSPIGKERADLLTWIDETRVLPRYLSDESRALYFEKKHQVDHLLSQAKIDDVLFSFKKLEKKEQEECFDQLVDLIKNEHAEEEQALSDLPYTQNKKWDLEEWIVLVKVYFENKEKTRSELTGVFTELSSMLNRRACVLGIDHDEKYRNINGLAMQFDRIKYLDTHGEKGLSAYSELAEIAINMYKNERDNFDLIASRCWKKYGAA